MSSYDDMFVVRVPNVARKTHKDNILCKLKKFFSYFENFQVLLVTYLLVIPGSSGLFVLPRKPNSQAVYPPSSKFFSKSSISTAKPTRNQDYYRKVSLPTAEEVNFKHFESFVPKYFSKKVININSNYNFSRKQLNNKEIVTIKNNRKHLINEEFVNVQDNFNNKQLSNKEVASDTVSKDNLLLDSSNFFVNNLENYQKNLEDQFDVPSKYINELDNPVNLKNQPNSNNYNLQSKSNLRHHTKRSLPSMDSIDADTTGFSVSQTTVPTSRESDWINPCPNLDSSLDTESTTESFSSHILSAILEAKSQIDSFVDNYAQEIFYNVSTWAESTSQHEGYALPFLDNSSSIDLRVPAGLNFSTALQEAYELMQRRAVAVEQVTLDQALYRANFLTNFRGVEDRIVHVLCELRHAMVKKGVAVGEEITKDIMPEDARDIDGEVRRNIRDAVIVREYLKSLQILHSLFSHFAQ